MKSELQADPEPFDLTAGALCLDFANALDGRGSENPREKLTSYVLLVAWGEQAGVLDPPTARELQAGATGSPGRAQEVLSRAVALREGLYRIFAAQARERDPEPEDLELLNRALARSLSHLRIRLGSEGPAWSWSADPADLDRMLWPVAWSAARLLTSESRGRVRECASETCLWLFLDRSRNRSRRWCDMKVCGNRDKARRHYRKRRDDS